MSERYIPMQIDFYGPSIHYYISRVCAALQCDNFPIYVKFPPQTWQADRLAYCLEPAMHEF